MASHPIKKWRPEKDVVQQSSDDIWQAICTSAHLVMEIASVQSEEIRGAGFDATCLLVVLGEENKPQTVSPDRSDEQNVIVWMDHRSKGEAESYH